MSGAAILFAHRGARAHAPENTLEAFLLGLEMGATGLESDVWLTADGVAVLDHDGVAQRRSYGPGGRKIAAVDRADLPAHIPTLAELYEAVGPDTPLSLDLKDPAALDAVLRDARAAGAAENLWLCHPRWRDLAAWREETSDIHLVNSTFLGYMSSGPERRAKQLQAAGIDVINLHRSEWTPGLVALFARHGLATLGWDAQEPSTITELLEWGIDGVFSDHVDRMVEAAAAVALSAR